MAEKRFLCGCLIDGSGAGARRNVVMVVRDGLITAVSPAGARGEVSDDLSGCVVLPALFDCSVFLARSPSLAPDPAAGRDLVRRHLAYCRDHGVLGLAECGGEADLPRDPAVTVARAGRDFFRLRLTPDIDTPPEGASGFRPDPLPPAGRAAGGRTVAVANGAEGVAAALAAGCGAVEQGYGMGRENLERMAELGVLWIPSLLPVKTALAAASGGGAVCCRFSQGCVAPGKARPELAARWRRLMDGQMEQLRLARELGVTVAVGSGAGRPGIIPGEACAEELRLLLQAGYPFAEALRCASVNGARFFAVDAPGPLVPGRRATFIVTRGSAAQAPRKLSYPHRLYIDGERVFQA